VLRTPASDTTVTTSMLPTDHPTHSGRAASILDASRALAALAVVVEHARTALLVDPQAVAAPNAASALIYWLSGFGHQAVVVFFVLSGALVGGSVVSSVSSDTWSWRDYLVRRLSRLYIVLIPALLLIVLWDGAGIALFHGHSTYPDILSAITIGSHTLVVHNRSLVAFLGNAAFLMTIYVPVFGSGAALWSLSNEFWYYLLFPCLVIAVVQRRNSRRSVSSVVIATGILVFVSHDIVEWMIIWLLGVVIVRAPRLRIPERRASQLLAISLVVFGVTTALERSLLNTVSLGGDFAIATAFAVFLYCAYSGDWSTRIGVDVGRAPGIWKRLAGFSYTLYLFHQPPLAFANAWLVSTRNSRWQPTALHICAMLTVIVVVVLYSYAGSRATEAHTGALRRALRRSQIVPATSKLDPPSVIAVAAVP
jgi:peptidoglycan/LPS O-acetylase OafA/YrhL